MTPSQIAGALLNAGWRMEHLIEIFTVMNLGTTKQTAITVDSIAKSFGKVKALDSVSFSVEKGSVLAFLGPNGAGKTTLIKILTTLLTPDKGSANVAGFNLSETGKIRNAIGLTGQFSAVDDALTGKENIELVGRLYHLTQKETKKRTLKLLERFNLIDAANRPVKTYSGGMKRRLDLAASLINNPLVLFLDEPTTGLDPQSRLELWAIIKELTNNGATILLTTQYLEEADHLADKVVVIDKGRIIAEGTVQELKKSVGEDMVELHFSDEKTLVSAFELLSTTIQESPRVDRKTLRVNILSKNGTSALLSAMRTLDNSGIKITDVLLRRPSLDDAFLALTKYVT